MGKFRSDSDPYSTQTDVGYTYGEPVIGRHAAVLRKLVQSSKEKGISTSKAADEYAFGIVEAARK